MDSFFEILFKIEFFIGTFSLAWLGFTVFAEKLKNAPRWAAWLTHQFNALYSGSREASRRGRMESALTKARKPSMV